VHGFRYCQFFKWRYFFSFFSLRLIYEPVVAELCHVVWSCFRGEKAKWRHAKTPPNGDFFVFSHGDFSPRHTKVSDISCVAFSATVCRIFAWRGEWSPCENQNHYLAGFRVATFSRFRPENTLIRHGTYQPPYEPDILLSNS